MKTLLCLLSLTLPAFACGSGRLLEWVTTGLVEGTVTLATLFVPSLLALALLKWHKNLQAPAGILACSCSFMLGILMLDFGMPNLDVCLAAGFLAYVTARIGQRWLPDLAL